MTQMSPELSIYFTIIHEKSTFGCFYAVTYKSPYNMQCIQGIILGWIVVFLLFVSPKPVLFSSTEDTDVPHYSSAVI